MKWGKIYIIIGKQYDFMSVKALIYSNDIVLKLSHGSWT